MKRPFFITLFRFLLSTVILGIGLALLLPLAVYLFFNPNDYKKEITTFLTQRTGLPFQLEGEMKVTFFPWLGVSAKEVILPQPATYGSTPFVTLSELGLKVSLKALFEKQIKIETLLFKNAQIYAVKNEKGLANWDYFLKQIQTATTSSPPSSTPSTKKETSQKFTFTIDDFKIEDGQLYYQDKQTKQEAHLKQLNIQGQWQPHATPFEGKFHFTFSPGAPSSIWQGEGKIKGELKESNTLFIKKLDIYQKAMHLQGKGTLFFTPRFSFKGDFFIDRWLLQDLLFTNIKGNIKKDTQSLTLAPLTADFYQGQLVAQLSQATPKAPFLIQGDLKQVEMASLLTGLKKEPRVKGKADLHFNLTHAEKSQQGKITFQIKNGSLQGFDLKYYLAMGQALLKKQPSTIADTKVTPFTSVNGSLLLQNSLLTNPDLTLVSPDFRATGQGSFNLASQTLSYKLEAWKQYDDGKEHPNAYPLAVRITGSFNQPRIEPDFDLYLKTALQREMKKQINKQLDRKLGKILGSDSQENATDTEKSVSPEDKIKQKVGKELQRGLEKIFH